MHPHKNLAFFSAFLFFFFILGVGHSAQVTLSWDELDDDRIEGYNVYCGILGTDFKTTPLLKINSGNQTRCIISGVEEGQLYGFAVTSIDGYGNESVFSEVIYHKISNENGADGKPVSDMDRPENQEVNTNRKNQESDRSNTGNLDDGEVEEYSEKDADSGCFIFHLCFFIF